MVREPSRTHGVRRSGSECQESGTERLTAEGFRTLTGVSRETLDRLQAYAGLLSEWQRAVNLVAASTLADLWRRHMLDSAQLASLLPPDTRSLVDLGSGAGFPGLVLAILGVPEVHLIERDQRKAVFLREAARITGVAPRVAIHAVDIAAAPALTADVVSARALAPLDRLLPLARRFCRPDTVCLFLKGQDIDKELTAATRTATFAVERCPSLSDPRGTVLRLEGLGRD